MKNSILFWMGLLVVAATTLGACSVNSSLLAGDWKLVSYGPVSQQTPVAADVKTSLTFRSDGKLTGNMGCNSFGGDYQVSGNAVTFGLINSTLMACPEPIMQQESSVFILFSGTSNFRVAGNILTLTSADGQSQAVFTNK